MLSVFLSGKSCFTFMQAWRQSSSFAWLLWDELGKRGVIRLGASPCVVRRFLGGRYPGAGEQTYGIASSGALCNPGDSRMRDSPSASSTAEAPGYQSDTGLPRSASVSPTVQTSYLPPPPMSKALGRRRGEHAAKAQEHPSPSPGLLSVLGAMAGLVRGVGSTGLGVGHITFGLQALARRHEEQRLSDHPEGEQLAPGPITQATAERLLDALELAHGAYRRNAAALAATTCLRAKNVRVWRPEGGSLRPGYYVAVDYVGRRVVWGVRGSRVFSDLLTDLAMAAHPLGSGAAHWGMTHAAHWLIQQEATRVAALLQSLGPPGAYQLQLVGHSLGGSVAALAAMMLRERLVKAARAAAIPPELISCTAFAPPAVVSPQLAEICRPYVTSVVLNNDIVPRFNASSLARLQAELRDVDWHAELQRTIMDHALVKNLSTRLEVFTPTPIGSMTAQVLPKEFQSPDAGASVVQQLSAAVLESAAFKAAVQALDEWKAKAVAAAGEQADAAMRRQLEVVQTWLQDLAAFAQPKTNRSNPDLRSRSEMGSPPEPQEAGQRDVVASDTAMDIRCAAEAAAERLRQSIELAVLSLSSAATASKERLGATLPSLPSLPQPHELPLIESRSNAMGAGAPPTANLDGVDRVMSQAAWSGGISSTEGGEDAAPSLPSWVAAGVAQLEQFRASEELPLLLPPGRILYIRPHTEEQPPPQQLSETSMKIPATDESVRCAGASKMDGVCDDAVGAATVSASRHGYVVLEVPKGKGFRRLVLGRSALEEHQCKTYRRVLSNLAFKETL